MSSNLNTVLTSINNIVKDITSYTELTHILDISLNKFGVGKRYGVVPRRVEQSTGNTMRITQDYYFSIILTDTYISQSLNDKEIVAKAVELMAMFDNIHKECAKTKCNQESIVMLVDGFDITEPIVLIKEKTIIIESVMKVKCNYSL
jgi:hypothetical protein